MNLHLLLTQDNRPDLAQRVKQMFGDNVREIAPNQWVIAADETDRAISDKLDASEGQFGRVMIATITTYYGWHERDLWDWLSIKEGK